MVQDFLSGNRLTLLENGSGYFPALLAAIDGAKSEVSLETYIFGDDATGRAVAAALVRAAGRGVAVRLLVDGFGSAGFHRRFMPMLEAAGVRALVYQRFRFFPAFSRLHRKVAVVDGQAAFAGGINILDDDARLPGLAPWRLDYAVRIEGPLVARIDADTRQLWNQVAWHHFKRRWRVPVNRNRRAGRLGRRLPRWLRGALFPDDGVPPPCAPAGEARAAWLVRDNLRHRRDIEDAYLAALSDARQEIFLANAYFLPSRRFRRALGEAAARGVKVTVLVQGLEEYAVAHHASQAVYEPLLVAGIRLFAYQTSFLHAKVAVVDRRWATVGSSNLDPLSLMLAREANLAVLDNAFAGRLQASLEAAAADGAREILLEEVRRRPWPARLLSRLAHGAVWFLAELAGRGKHAG